MRPRGSDPAGLPNAASAAVSPEATMLAIPSPDLFVNLFASAAQLLGLLTVMCGGLVARRRAQPQRAGGSRRLNQVLGFSLCGTLAALLLFWLSVREAEQQRLRINLMRSSTEAGKAVGDASLKTLGASEQLQHPCALQTEALAAGLATGWQVIDVREPEEIEAGRVAGARALRYPDIQAEPGLLGGREKRFVLMCFSGNRSSELAEQLAAAGWDARFVVGGYEKWIAEGRPLDTEAARRELRALPAFPGHDVLLSTAVVRDLEAERRPLFVDVRYPADFAKGHLPGAINMPLRKLRSAEIETALQALPDRPLIVPCYDKRSSFYASILALRWHRMGREFVGRYTLPHEYVKPRQDRAWVAEWKQHQAGLSPWGMLVAGLQSCLQALQGWTGSLLAAICLLLLGLRLVLLPLSLPTERESWRRKFLAPRLQGLRERFADDPQLLQRERQLLLRRAGMHPLRGFALSMTQLLVFLAMFPAINTLAADAGLLGQPDPSGLLPLAVAGLVAWMILAGVVERRLLSRRRVFAALGAALLFGGLTWELPRALNIYLVLNLLWICLQSRLAWSLERPRQRTRGHAQAHRPLRLSEVAADARVGNKALRLGTMTQHGLPVPRGFCIPAGALPDGSCSPALLAQAERAFDRLGLTQVAVRSSGLDEDGEDQSFAGVFDSVLNVGRTDLADAMHRVAASFSDERAHIYAQGSDAAILVQAMVDAEYAGVMFTEHPGHCGECLVEMSAGLGEDLVSGKVRPDAYRFTRLSQQAVDGSEAPIDLRPLLRLGAQVEALFGGPQDIEWAYAKGQFFLLQARDITAGATEGGSDRAILEAQRQELLQQVEAREGGELCFVQDELSELLPAPTHYSLELMQDIWAAGGTVELASRRMGVPYEVSADAPNYLVDLFGQVAVNAAEKSRRSAKGLSALAGFRMARMADALAAEVESEFAPRMQARQDLDQALDLSRLTVTRLIRLLEEVRTRFLTESYLQAECVNIAAATYMDEALRRVQRAGLDPAAVLADAEASVVQRALQILQGSGSESLRRERFLALFGHRAAHDFELAEPRFGEAPAQLRQMMATHQDGKRRRQQAVELPSRVLRAVVARAQRFQALKELAKHHATQDLAMMRRILLAIGAKTGLDEAIFWLSAQEVAGLVDEGSWQRCLGHATHRERRAELGRALELQGPMSLADLETLSFDGSQAMRIREVDGDVACSGTWISGAEAVEGRVRVCYHAAELADFEAGEILVARCTDPTWAMAFPRATGIITDLGGWLSHAAILARECGLPAVVGTEQGTRLLRSGDQVRMHPSGEVQLLQRAPKVPVLASGQAG